MDVTKYAWTYVNEGNLNIVLGCEDIGKVIRIRKATSEVEDDIKKKVTPRTRVVLLQNCISAWEFTAQQQKLFVENILKPLVSKSEYFLDMDIIQVPKRFLEHCQTVVDVCRPPHRASRKIDLAQPSVQLLPHICALNDNWLARNEKTICVEIKPKWGFLPTSTLISANHVVKYKTCRFCMMQQWKLQKEKTFQISHYCPLDLFRGCSCKLEAALERLLEVPQNNLVVHIQGKCLPVADLSSWVRDQYCTRENFVKIICKVFLDDSLSTLQKYCWLPKDGSLLHLEKDCHGQTIVHRDDCIKFGPGGILKCIQALQMLDTTDIEGIVHLFKSSDLLDVLPGLMDFDSFAWRRFVAQQSSSENAFYEQEVPLNELQKYLVSLTMKDLSIALTFSEIRPDRIVGDRNLKNVVTDFSGKIYAYQLKMIDLDPKCLLKIPDYAEQDHDIVKAYTKAICGQECCSGL